MPCDQTNTKQIVLHRGHALFHHHDAMHIVGFNYVILQSNYSVIINVFVQEDYDEEELTFDLIAVNVNTIN